MDFDFPFGLAFQISLVEVWKPLQGKPTAAETQRSLSDPMARKVWAFVDGTRWGCFVALTSPVWGHYTFWEDDLNTQTRTFLATLRNKKGKLGNWRVRTNVSSCFINRGCPPFAGIYHFGGEHPPVNRAGLWTLAELPRKEHCGCANQKQVCWFFVSYNLTAGL